MVPSGNAMTVCPARSRSATAATTAGNLIDSMGTEVVQTDYTIRDLVPGEPLTYAEAVRRALEEGPR